ncbi:MAG: inositol-3-phosphate synthase, partial [Acidobacteria bacterium]|nr:inositol-3-phosphate synthase [Acidobacteriota bacterium]
MSKGIPIQEPKGNLGVLLPGMGAVATTFIAGVEAVRRKLGLPIGSLTQMGTIRLGKRTEKRVPTIQQFVPLASLDDLVFGGWDIRDENCYETACHGGVLERHLLEQVQGFLESIRPMPAVFDQNYVRRLNGTHVKQGQTKWELAQMLQEDIENFRTRTGVSRTVMVWCGSTEIFLKPQEVHRNLENFEGGLKENHPAIAPSMIYAYAALKMGVPFANGAPNLTVDIPALVELAKQNSL